MYCSFRGSLIWINAVWSGISIRILRIHTDDTVPINVLDQSFALGNLYTFLSVVYFSSKVNLLKKYSMNIIRESNSLNPDQARHSVGPGLDPTCLQLWSADDIIW